MKAINFFLWKKSKKLRNKKGKHDILFGEDEKEWIQSLENENYSHGRGINSEYILLLDTGEKKINELKCCHKVFMQNQAWEEETERKSHWNIKNRLKSTNLHSITRVLNETERRGRLVFFETLFIDYFLELKKKYVTLGIHPEYHAW